MEAASFLGRERVIFVFEFDMEVVDEGERAPRQLIDGLIRDIQPNVDELRYELDHAAVEAALPVQVESVEIREGSILIFVAAVVGIAKALDLYGGARQGMNQILRDLGIICERFLRRFGGRNMRPRMRMVTWVPANGESAEAGDSAPSAPQTGHNHPIGILYLLVSNLLLLSTVIGVLVVLLVRTA